MLQFLSLMLFSSCCTPLLAIRYGMKGKIDVTVDARHRGRVRRVPLELKTGRPSYSAEHKGQVRQLLHWSVTRCARWPHPGVLAGQVTMYSMMLDEKLNSSSNCSSADPGLLVYLKDGSMQDVQCSNMAAKGTWHVTFSPSQRRWIVTPRISWSDLLSYTNGMFQALWIWGTNSLELCSSALWKKEWRRQAIESKPCQNQ